MNNNTKSLKNLKPGDKVILLFSNWGSRSLSVETVEKITPKGYIRVRNMLFYPNTGYCRGDQCYKLFEATPARIEEINQAEFTRSIYGKIQELPQFSLTYEMAVELSALFDKWGC